MDSIPSFTDERAGRLRAFLESEDRSEGTMGLSELGGFLFALSCSPQSVAPSAWVPLVFGGDEPEYETLDEARDAIDLLLSFHNSVHDQVRSGTPALPACCETSREPLSNLGPDAPLGAWARGFLEGHQWLEELWDELLPEDLHDELASQLMILSFFSSRELAEGFHREVGGEDGLEQMAGTMLRLVPDAMAAYARLGRSIEQALRELEQRRTPTRSDKVGRNEPCPCGSGKKYKRCCGAG